MVPGGGGVGTAATSAMRHSSTPDAAVSGTSPNGYRRRNTYDLAAMGAVKRKVLASRTQDRSPGIVCALLNIGILFNAGK